MLMAISISDLREQASLFNYVQSAVAILLTVVTVTRFVSTLQFNKNARISNQLPTAPYWLPGVYHLFELSFDPSVFIQKLLNSYGHLGPFLFRAGPISCLVVSDPAHIKSIFLASKQFTAREFHLTVFGKVLGLPKKALEIYAADETTSEDARAVHFAHLPLNRQYMSGEALSKLTRLYVETLRKNLSHMNVQANTWTEVEDLWTFFRQEIPKTIMEVVLGSSIFDMYPDLVDQFWAFDDNVQEYSRGLWKPLLTLSPNAARDRILGSLEKWIFSISSDATPGQMESTLEQEPFWNAHTGSKLFRHRDSIFANISAMGIDGRASETLGLLQGANANTMPSTFWYIFEALKDTNLQHRLQHEIHTIRAPNSQPTAIQKLCSNPLLQSMHSEVTRLRMATAIIRTVDTDEFMLDKTFHVPKGTTILAFPSDYALKTDAWRSVRPQTTARPLDEFWAYRFLVPGGKDDKSGDAGSGVDVECSRFNMEGLNGLHFTFGGGQNMCPGRAWARNIQIATLAVLLGEYEVELVDPVGASCCVPSLRERAVGVIRPLAKIPVRIRARKER